jgi:hypothetical protein
VFVENKYFKYYYSIINRAKSRVISGYTESHHIIPRSLGGLDNKENLVDLTAKEHFICHLLLTKITFGKNKRSMIFALNALSNLNNPYQNRYRSRLYEISRRIFADEQSVAMSGAGNPMYGKHHSHKSKQKMSNSHLGKKPWNYGKALTDTHKQKISKSNSGENNFMFGKTHSDESKKAISNKNTGHSYNKGILKSADHKKAISEKLKGKELSEEHKQKLKNIPKIKCNYCNKLASPSMHKRWHGEKCKNKIS